jgi:hypothetical protein
VDLLVLFLLGSLIYRQRWMKGREKDCGALMQAAPVVRRKRIDG